MALSDVAANLTDPGVPWRTCATCHALASMTPAEASVLRKLLSDRGVKFRDLELALSDDPDSPNIPSESLSRHARGLCTARERLRS